MSSKTMTVNNIVFNPNQIINDKTLVIRDTSYLKSLFVTNTMNNSLYKLDLQLGFIPAFLLP
ncbi:hypothetical protein J6P52_01360 [bacterium]|nr:hypothetical protein [bacterium]